MKGCDKFRISKQVQEAGDTPRPPRAGPSRRSRELESQGTSIRSRRLSWRTTPSSAASARHAGVRPGRQGAPRSQSNPTLPQVQHVFAGNVCRCGTYASFRPTNARAVGDARASSYPFLGNGRSDQCGPPRRNIAGGYQKSENKIDQREHGGSAVLTSYRRLEIKRVREMDAINPMPIPTNATAAAGKTIIFEWIQEGPEGIRIRFRGPASIGPTRPVDAEHADCSQYQGNPEKSLRRSMASLRGATDSATSDSMVWTL